MTSSHSLASDGVTVARQVLDAGELSALRGAVEELIARDSTGAAFPFHGSMIPIPVWSEPFAELVAHERVQRELAALGCRDVRWLSGYVISKPPSGEALWWHQDWWAWDEPCSYDAPPPQVFVMCYLTSTSRQNGCLRVLPGTHRAAHPLHAQLPPAHSDELNALAADSIAHANYSDERDVPVEAGDIVIGDSRVLHATHANRSDQRRHCITLWYAPNFSALPAALRAKLAGLRTPPPPDAASSRSWARVEPLLPSYDGAWEGPWPYERRPSRLGEPPDRAG